MLTVDFERLRIGPGTRVLDVGCGAGRHSIEALRRGAVAVALDYALTEVGTTRRGAGETAALLGSPLRGGAPRGVCGDATRLPFADGSFDVVIASEVLEHLPEDSAAMAELARVVRPGGAVAVTVPRSFPERVCWALSDDYHTAAGGHVRIYSGRELRDRLGAAGLRVTGWHHAHALHSPYWWLRCAVGVNDDTRRLVRVYHRFLVWDLMKRPALTRVAERVLSPLLGKSLAIYTEAPRQVRDGGAAAA